MKTVGELVAHTSAERRASTRVSTRHAGVRAPRHSSTGLARVIEGVPIPEDRAKIPMKTVGELVAHTSAERRASTRVSTQHAGVRAPRHRSAGLARAAVLLSVAVCASAATPRIVHDVTVYREAGRYGGWPANHGIWIWGNEILVGFSAAYFQLKTPDRHQYDNKKPEEPRLARSLDGGESWTIEAPPSLLPPEQGGAAVTDLDKPMDFTDPNFAMTLRFTDTNKGPSRFWYSVDRGRIWRGPYAFPLLDQTGIAARTDYIVNGKHDAFVFLTAAKSDGKEGRVLCARTEDGG